MDPRTLLHLARAQHHRQVAQALGGPAGAHISDLPPLDWAVIAAFYAAVHYVNAYLWEAQRYEPADHVSRQQAVALVRLRSVAQAYSHLRVVAFQARYLPRYRPNAPAIRLAIDVQLEAVRRVARPRSSCPAPERAATLALPDA